MAHPLDMIGRFLVAIFRRHPQAKNRIQMGLLKILRQRGVFNGNRRLGGERGRHPFKRRGKRNDLSSCLRH